MYTQELNTEIYNKVVSKYIVCFTGIQSRKLPTINPLSTYT